jgi:FkbM family methyltransferase
MKKKVFLDLGTHFAEGLKRFIEVLKIDSSWEVHTFEANPRTYEFLNGQERSAKSGLNITFHNKAVGIADGTATLNIETVQEYQDAETGMGSTLVSMEDWHIPATAHKYENQVQVECIDFPKWVDNLFSNPDCEIYCKIDIEGAEFDILEHLIASKSIGNFKAMYIEFHDWAMKDKDTAIKRKDNITQQLKAKGVGVFPW